MHDATFHYLVDLMAKSLDAVELTVEDFYDVLRLAHASVVDAEIQRRANEVRLHVPHPRQEANDGE